MCKVLMSINPEYVEKILSGTKKYEFRKSKCKREVSEIIIYSTAPVSKVVGKVKVKNIIEENLDMLWDITKEFSGIEYDFFKKYYDGREKGAAYQLGAVTKFKQPKKLDYYGVKAAPQSYVYID